MRSILEKIILLVVFLTPGYFGIQSLLSSFQSDYFQIPDFIFGAFLCFPLFLYGLSILFPLNLTNINVDLTYKDLKQHSSSGLAKYLSVFFSFLSLSIGIGERNENQTIQNQKDFATVPITLTEAPRIKGKIKSLAPLKSKEYPDYQFNLPSFYQDYFDSNAFKSETKMPATLYLTISRNDYLKKIKKTKEPSFLEKHFGWRFINVYGLSSSTKTFYDLSSIGNYRSSLKKGQKFYWLLAAALLAIAFYLKIKDRTPAPKIHRLNP
ncbi:hypothetical protein [Bergeyella sp. RCAD1439]|uniref:hypothetical protein n=1 Tax=Bergeyella anatis TaxID=3113737 RepID=UPI002E181C88|nr:hypothetical protein [Bergeyella sp. RCAD1439]